MNRLCLRQAAAVLILCLAVLTAGCGSGPVIRSRDIVAAQESGGGLVPEEVNGASDGILETAPAESGTVPSGSASGGAAGGIHQMIYIIIPTDSGFSAEGREVLTQALIGRGYDVTVRVCDDDIGKQTAAFAEAAAYAARAVVCSNMDKTETLASVRETREAGVPTVLVGRELDVSGAAAGQIITNKAERIPDLADWLTERDGGRPYLLLRGAENDSLASDLSDLYKNAVRRTAGADCAGEEIQKTDDAAEAAALTVAYLADHPEIGTIVCAGDAQTVGAVQGVEGAGRTDVTVICLNGESDDIASLVEEGRVAAAVVRSPERVALAAAEMLDNFFNTSAYSLRERYYVSADILTADGIQLPD